MPTARRSVPGPEPRRATFVREVRLSKDEAFAACQALADADRVLLRSGGRTEALALGDLFALLEERLVAPGARSVQVVPGSYSSERELTQ